MKIAFFSAQDYDKRAFDTVNAKFQYSIDYIEEHLSVDSANQIHEHQVIVCFVNDHVTEAVIDALTNKGIKLIALRCAGFNQVNLAYAKKKGIAVVRVPAYSPYSVAEFAVGMLLTLNRQYHRAHNHVREHNFSLKGLMGFDLHNKTIGIIGTGKIGCVFATIMKGFGCKLLAYDLNPNPECKEAGVTYVKLETLLKDSDVISLHCPLTPQTQHIINADTISLMKNTVTLINTGRGGLIDTPAVIDALKASQIGHLGIDVYEEEEELFFEDRTDEIIQDDQFLHLQSFPNVLITGQQAFLTNEALHNIAETTLQNICDFKEGKFLENEV
jgi:D-lactate dehydrogenase